jgi:hypothetical protein
VTVCSTSALVHPRGSQRPSPNSRCRRNRSSSNPSRFVSGHTRAFICGRRALRRPEDDAQQSRLFNACEEEVALFYVSAPALKGLIGICEKVEAFAAFTAEDDPHKQRDFAAFEIERRAHFQEDSAYYHATISRQRRPE